MTAEVSFHWHF